MADFTGQLGDMTSSFIVYKECTHHEVMKLYAIIRLDMYVHVKELYLYLII